MFKVNEVFLVCKHVKRKYPTSLDVFLRSKAHFGIIGAYRTDSHEKMLGMLGLDTIENRGFIVVTCLK